MTTTQKQTQKQTDKSSGSDQKNEMELLRTQLAELQAKNDALEQEKQRVDQEKRAKERAELIKTDTIEGVALIKERIKRSWGHTDQNGRIAAHIAFNTLTIAPGDISKEIGNSPIALGAAHGNGLQENKLMQQSIVALNEMGLIKLDSLIAHKGKPPFNYNQVKTNCWPLPEMKGSPDTDKIWEKILSS